MQKYYRYVNLLVRATLTPKISDASSILSSICLLLLALKDDDDERSLSAFDFLYREIKTTSLDPRKSCTHAPYIMKMIEVVTKKSFNKEMRHEPNKLMKILVDQIKKRGRKPRRPQPQESF